MRTLRQAWLWVLTIGLGVFCGLVALVNSGNGGLIGAMIVVGSAVVPVSMVTYIGSHERRLDMGRHRLIPPGSIIWTFLVGGAIGVITAGLVEFFVLRQLNISQLFLVGLVEETVKLIVPVFIFLEGRYRSEADGLLFGIASGMGFAMLETIGYGLTAFAQSSGDVTVVEQTLLARGLLSPAGHAAWTGMVCAVLWRQRDRAGRPVFNLAIAGAFVAAIVLHALWDISGMSNVPAPATALGYVVIGGASLVLLGWHIRHAGRQPA